MHLLCLWPCHLTISPGDLHSKVSITGDSDREVLHCGSCTNDNTAGFIDFPFHALGEQRQWSGYKLINSSLTASQSELVSLWKGIIMNIWIFLNKSFCFTGTPTNTKYEKLQLFLNKHFRDAASKWAFQNSAWLSTSQVELIITCNTCKVFFYVVTAGELVTIVPASWS